MVSLIGFATRFESICRQIIVQQTLNDRASLQERLFRAANLVATLRMGGRSRGWSRFIELRIAS